MVGTICDKCTMTVPTSDQSCRMCNSWRCDACESFSLPALLTCGVCGQRRVAKTARPPPQLQPSVASPTLPAAPPPLYVAPALHQYTTTPPPQPAPLLRPTVTVGPAHPPYIIPCSRCTFHNSASASSCSMCESPLIPSSTSAAARPSPPPPQASPVTVVPAAPPAPVVATSPFSAESESSTLRQLRARRSTAVLGDDTFAEQLNEAVSMCQQLRTPFVAHLNAEEAKSLQWGSIFTTLRPGLPDVPSNVLASDSFLTALARLIQPLGSRPTSNAPANGWKIFPAGGVSADDIAQGQLGDCWFLSAAAVLAHARPDLIEKLFLVKEVTPEGVFGVQLWCDGVWKPFLVDGTFPTAHNGRFFRYARCKRNDALWVPLLEKAYAFMHGSYAAIVSGACEEAFYDLTGMPCDSIRFAGERFNPEETFVKMVSWASSKCVMGTSCGGSSDCVGYARSLKLEDHHCYSVLDVAVCRATKRRLVRLRNPWGRTDFMGEEPPEGFVEDRPCSGSFWMLFDQYIRAFSDVTICYTRPFANGYSAQPICTPMSSYLPALRCPNGVGESVALLVPSATRLHVMGTQQKRRGLQGSAGARGYFDLAFFVMKVDPQNGTMQCVAASAGENNRVVAFDLMVDPGMYAIMPFSLQQHQSRTPQLVVSAMSESPDVTQLAWDDVVPLHAPLNRILLNFLSNDHPHVSVRPAGLWTAISWTRGTLRFDMVKSGLNNASDVTASNRGSVGVVALPAGERTLRLPPRGEAIMWASSALPHDGSYSVQWAIKWSFQEVPAFNRIAEALTMGQPSSPSSEPPLFQPVKSSW